jgi:hypothetical protein
MYVVLLLVFLSAMKIPRKHTQELADWESMFCQRMMKMNSLIIEVLSPLYEDAIIVTGCI